MKNYSLVLIIFSMIVLILIGGCSSAASAPSLTSTTEAARAIEVAPADAYNLIQNNLANQDFVILDVRTPEEFNSGHIAAAIDIDFYAQDFKDQITKLDRNKRHLVYCRSGARSTLAVQIMLDLGFKSLWNLTGGITQWTADGYPVVSQ